MKFDAQVVRQDPDILAMADKFVFVRIVRFNGVDLNVFRFDYDLPWMSFFISADLRVYARYGGREAQSAESRLSKAGLLHTMNEVLRLHQEAQQKKLPPPKLAPPRLPDDLPVLKSLAAKEGRCIRCHMVNDALNVEAFKRKDNRETRQDSYYAFPVPETVGLAPELVQGTKIKAVTPGSPADKAGVRQGDVFRTVNGLPVVTTFDIQHALNEVGTAERLTVAVERSGQPLELTLTLPAGWRRWDTSWRKSLANAWPPLGVGGEELSAEDRKALQLPADGLAFRVSFVTPDRAFARAGLQKGDVIVEADGQRKLPYVRFRGYLPLQHQPGDRIELIYLRAGKEIKTVVAW